VENLTTWDNFSNINVSLPTEDEIIDLAKMKIEITLRVFGGF